MQLRTFCWKRNGGLPCAAGRENALIMILLRSTIPESGLTDVTRKLVELLS